MQGLTTINYMLTCRTYRGQMSFPLQDLRLSTGLVLLLTSASCVPSAGSAGRINPVAVPAATAKPVDDERMRRARAIFWQRASKLLEPVSATPAAPFDTLAMDETDRSRSLECLTSAVYHEARSEPVDGQRAVAQVVLNRVRHPAFPSSVCGVVFQGSHRRTGCQFSFTCDGSLARRREPGAWERSREIAEAALAGDVFAPVGNATHYHTTAIRPYWAPSLRRSAIVGSHIFYRWGGSAGETNAFSQRYGGLEPTVASWESVPVADARDLPRVHRGSAEQLAERVQVDDGVVTIHRGGSGKPAMREARETHGVRIHVGSGAPKAEAETGAAEPAAG